MPFNPRRHKGPVPPEPIALTDEEIAHALERAAELRRQVVEKPEDVSIVAMSAYDVIRTTQSYRTRSEGYRRRYWQSREEDPWWWIGWVKQETTMAVPDEFGMTRFERTWEVWFNVADGRVWLKPQ